MKADTNCQREFSRGESLSMADGDSPNTENRARWEESSMETQSRNIYVPSNAIQGTVGDTNES